MLHAHHGPDCSCGMCSKLSTKMRKVIKNTDNNPSIQKNGMTYDEKALIGELDREDEEE